ncbi:hypothetical protein PGTUg99_000891 [Puccinia graminis f. sp. tritici]|uniref:Torus domain-containing protein n=1 Tax=Puccinia graminis f. sp. tritici TaxID=56615 RepID=A0A5B0SAC0_PUCGR|nr:hypothetical protein PGTUg99_000891 [Puccinia graminis f. sp. tritici]
MAHVPQQPTEKQITVADQPVRKKVKRRPARKQVTLEQAAAVKKQPEQNGQTYNVWYNKWAGGGSIRFVDPEREVSDPVQDRY